MNSFTICLFFKHKFLSKYCEKKESQTWHQHTLKVVFTPLWVIIIFFQRDICQYLKTSFCGHIYHSRCVLVATCFPIVIHTHKHCSFHYNAFLTVISFTQCRRNKNECNFLHLSLVGLSAAISYSHCRRNKTERS